MNKTLCDKCGAVIIAEPYKVAIIPDAEDSDGIDAMDFCPACIRTICIGIKTKEHITHRYKKPLTNRGRKSTVDKGKVCALWRAGWDLNKIADEMGVTSVRIRQILQDMGEW